VSLEKIGGSLSIRRLNLRIGAMSRGVPVVRRVAHWQNLPVAQSAAPPDTFGTSRSV
jgi:hypothetical protein